MPRFDFAYGSGRVQLDLPENARYQELHGHNQPPIEDIPAALRAALEAPIHEKPLRSWLQPGDAVTLIISDMSRFWMRQDLVIPALVEYMEKECGIRMRIW